MNNQAAAGFNNPVQMGSANPFATTVEDPWLGINPVLGSNNMVIQPLMNATISAHNGPANMQLPNGQRKRSRVSINQVNNQNVYYPVLDYAPQHIQSILNILKEQDAEITNLWAFNNALREVVKDLVDENQKLIECAITWKIKTVSLHTELEAAMAEVRRLQGLVAANCAVAASHEEQEVRSYCGSNVSAENTPENSQSVAKVEDGETAAEEVQTGAAEMGEGSARLP